MSNPFFYLVPYKFFFENFNHKGILGQGYDSLFEITSTNHILEEKDSLDSYVL